MNNLLPYSIKRKRKTNWRLIFIAGLIIVALIVIIKIDRQVKNIPFNNSQPVKEVEQELIHRFDPREKEIEIVRENGKFRIKSPAEIIREVAQQENFNDPDFLIRLCECESSTGERMSNNKRNKPSFSEDRGWFQINSYWHNEVSEEQAYNIRFATKFAINLIKAGQANQFICTKLIK